MDGYFLFFINLMIIGHLTLTISLKNASWFPGHHTHLVLFHFLAESHQNPSLTFSFDLLSMLLTLVIFSLYTFFQRCPCLIRTFNGSFLPVPESTRTYTGCTGVPCSPGNFSRQRFTHYLEPSFLVLFPSHSLEQGSVLSANPLCTHDLFRWSA